MPLAGFEPTIPVFKREKTFHTLDRVATVTGPAFQLEGTNSWCICIVINYNTLSVVCVSLRVSQRSVKVYSTYLSTFGFNYFHVWRGRHYVHHKSPWPDLGSNPSRPGGKQAVNRLSYGTTYTIRPYFGPTDSSSHFTPLMIYINNVRFEIFTAVVMKCTAVLSILILSSHRHIVSEVVSSLEVCIPKFCLHFLIPPCAQNTLVIKDSLT
jgi:hypothetical protein